MGKEGSWIFLCHASRDIHKVRQVRNEFERHGHNPLAFHLKCLNTDTAEAKAELDNLIKREIDAREWFVFCNSPAADESEYVQMEKEYISAQEKQFIWTLDMTQEIDRILKRVESICNDLEVFLSYAHRDVELADRLQTALEQMDFRVWRTGEDLLVGAMYWHQISWVIKRTRQQGAFAILLTENSVQSQFVKDELLYAMNNRAIILPVKVGTDWELPASLNLFLCTLQWLVVPANPTVDDFARALKEWAPQLREHIRQRNETPL